MITDIFNKNVIKILALFSVSPGSRFTRKEVQEKTLLNNVTLDSALDVLFKNKLLRKEKRFLGLDFQNEGLKAVLGIVKKEHIRFKEIPLKVYYILLDVSQILSANKNIKEAYLFGSYAKLIYTDRSDIDVAVFLGKHSKSLVGEIKNAASKIEKRYNKDIQLHFFEKKDLKQKDPIIREITRNGVCLF